MAGIFSVTSALSPRPAESNPGNAVAGGHANIDPGTFLTMHAGNPFLTTPKTTGSFVMGASTISFFAGVPVLLDPVVRVAAIAAGLLFNP